MPRNVALALLILLTNVAVGQDWDISTLMESLSVVTAPTTSFVEKRYSSLLEQPLIITGELEYHAPDTLVRRMLTPKLETFIIAGKHVTIQRPRQKDRYLPLSAAPALDGLAQALRSVLAGDLSDLQSAYTTQLSGAENCWELHLTPKDVKVFNELTELVIRGQQQQLNSFTALEPDGDRVVIMLSVSTDATE